MNFAKYAKVALISTLAIAMTTEAFAIDAAATRALNVRTGPGTGYSVLDTLYTGQIVDVTECDGSGWCFINSDGASGWVSSSYLSQVDYGNAASGWGRPVQGHRNPPQQPSPPPPSSTSDDVAGALAFAAILGIGALVIGSAIDQNNNAQNNNPPPKPNNCAPGSAWNGPGSNCRPPHGHR